MEQRKCVLSTSNNFTQPDASPTAPQQKHDQRACDLLVAMLCSLKVRDVQGFDVPSQLLHHTTAPSRHHRIRVLQNQNQAFPLMSINQMYFMSIARPSHKLSLRTERLPMLRGQAISYCESSSAFHGLTFACEASISIHVMHNPPLV
jgi:hypothetical protein